MSESLNHRPDASPGVLFDFAPDEGTLYLRMYDNYQADPLAWNLHTQSLAEANVLIDKRDAEATRYCEQLRRDEEACRLLVMKDLVERGILTDYPGEDDGRGLLPR